MNKVNGNQNGSNKVAFISESTAKGIEQQLLNLKEPGGLIHAYDEITGSLINVCARKQGSDIEVLSWSVYGPMSMEEAAKDVAKEMNIPIQKKHIQHH